MYYYSPHRLLCLLNLIFSEFYLGLSNNIPNFGANRKMAHIKNEAAYRVAMHRIDELLPLVNDETPTNDRNYIELD